jgi:hypothetical protein
MYAPHFFASSGEISGMGFAKANTIGSLFIFFISSEFSISHLLTQINISAQSRASFIVHEILFLLYFDTSFLYSFKSVRLEQRSHLESQNMIFVAHAFRRSFPMAMAAAHAHEITIFWLLNSVFFSFSALYIPARTTIAVQC